MEPQGPPPPPPPPPGRGQGPGRPGSRSEGLPKWSLWVLIGVFVAILAVTALASGSPGKSVSYDEFVSRVRDGEVEKAEVNNATGVITGEFEKGEKYTVGGPLEQSEEDQALFQKEIADLQYKTPQSSLLDTLLPLLIPVGLFVAFFWWMQRR